MRIRVTVTGRSYHLAENIPQHLVLPDGCSVDVAIKVLQEHLTEDKLTESCLVAVSGVHLGTCGNHQAQVLRDGDELLLLTPVAGG